MKKTLDEVCFCSKLTGDKATILVVCKDLEIATVSMTIGTEDADMETEMMISRISVGILGRSLTRHEEELLRKEMQKLIKLHELEDAGQDSTDNE